MTNTPNHNYNIPSEGTTNWHIPLNENFEQLDIDIEIRDLEANKKEYEPKAGVKYEATDSGGIYYGNGDTWVLVDRHINQLEANRVSIKQLQQDGPRIVSPSISSGYNSLQAAIDDAAEGGSSTIWIAENIKENIIVPTPEDTRTWWQRGGLKIMGISSGKETKIQDAAKDGTPIMQFEGHTISKLHLENLLFDHDFADTRAISMERFEGDEGGAMRVSTFKSCRFTAPVILAKLYHSYFEDCFFRPQVATVYEPAGSSYETSAGLIVHAGNQSLYNRCSWVSDTGDLKYGILWLMGHSSAQFNECFWSVPGEEYDKDADRPVAPLLIDAGGDYIFNVPYCELGADHSMVLDAIQGGGNTVDNVRINGSDLGNIKINTYVNGFVMDQVFQGHTLDLTSGIASEGSWIRTNSDTGSTVDVLGDNSKYLRIYNGRPPGWDVATPSVPSEPESGRRNDSSHPVLIYQSGAEGTTIDAYRGGSKTLPDDSGPVVLGVNESISYNTSPPDNWEWYGME